MKSVVKQGFFYEFAFDNKALKTLVEFRICWTCSKFERCRVRIRTSSHLCSRHQSKKMKNIDTACLEIARLVDEDVFWFQVAIYDIERVEILECQDDLCSVECCMWLAAVTTAMPATILDIRNQIKTKTTLCPSKRPPFYFSNNSVKY